MGWLEEMAGLLDLGGLLLKLLYSGLNVLTNDMPIASKGMGIYLHGCACITIEVIKGEGKRPTYIQNTG